MKLDTDRVVSISAMIAALGSLFIIVYQTHLMRQQQTAAALPYLMIVLTSNEHGAFINLGNVGVGPALIENVRVRGKGGTIEGDADVPASWYDNVGLPRGGEPKAVIEVTYTSVYGDRWRVTSDRIVPERL